jgi:hypothetical protein
MWASNRLHKGSVATAGHFVLNSFSYEVAPIALELIDRFQEVRWQRDSDSLRGHTNSMTYSMIILKILASMWASFGATATGSRTTSVQMSNLSRPERSG